MIEQTPTFFISANSQHGFFSLYEETFRADTFDKIFVILGGPGTGKSSLMRYLAEKATEMGARIEKIACSSDPDSLDGVIFTANGKRVGILDGTLPHAYTVKHPGYIEEICHLGAFWDEKKITAEKSFILENSAVKQNAYNSAYSLLEALGRLEKNKYLRLAASFDHEKARKHIHHKMQPLRQKGEQIRRFLRAYSCKGERILSLTGLPLQNVLLIRGKSVTAEIYLSFFADQLKESKIEHLVFLSPLSPSFAEGIYLPENQTLLIKEEYYNGEERARHLVAERFFKNPIIEEKKSKDAEKAIKELINKNLALAGCAHASLETVYSNAMDFKALTKCREGLLQKICSFLEIPSYIPNKKPKLCH